MSLFINNNCGPVYSECTVTIQNGQTTVQQPEDITPVHVETEQVDFFKYIHVAVTDDNERTQIHKMICNIVHLPRMKQICDELYQLIKKEKILSTIKPEAMLVELRRVGMPAADTPGFSDQNFYSNYKV